MIPPIAHKPSLIAVLALAFLPANAADKPPAIKALGEEQIDGYLDGRGMGLAKAAELNGYPGPAHVLEFADELGLSADQRRRTEALRTSVVKTARQLGARLVARERELDASLKAHRIDRESLATLTAEIGRLQGELRRVHLRAHLDETRLLSKEQIACYAQLRRHD